MAAIMALEALKRPSMVRNWLTIDRKPVKNAELWQRLSKALKPHDIRWHWVKGHAGHPENERADELARMGSYEARGKS